MEQLLTLALLYAAVTILFRSDFRHHQAGEQAHSAISGILTAEVQLRPLEQAYQAAGQRFRLMVQTILTILLRE